MLNELTQSVYQRYPNAKDQMRNWDYDSIDSIVCVAKIWCWFSGAKGHPRSKESLDALPYFIDFEVCFTTCQWCISKRSSCLTGRVEPWGFSQIPSYQYRVGKKRNVGAGWSVNRSTTRPKHLLLLFWAFESLISVYGGSIKSLYDDGCAQLLPTLRRTASPPTPNLLTYSVRRRTCQ